MNYKEDLVNYRLQRAKETLEEAGIMADKKKWNGCVNRLYYSCFYAANALLIQEGLSAKTHSGVKVLFAQHFIKTGKIPEDTGLLYVLLFDRRLEGDYKDFVKLSEEFVQPLIPHTVEFISLAEKLIKK